MENNGGSFAPEAMDSPMMPVQDNLGGGPIPETQYLGYGDGPLTSKVEGTKASQQNTAPVSTSAPLGRSYDKKAELANIDQVARVVKESASSGGNV